MRDDKHDQVSLNFSIIQVSFLLHTFLLSSLSFHMPILVSLVGILDNFPHFDKNIKLDWIYSWIP